jgi:hypothetical protein
MNGMSVPLKTETATVPIRTALRLHSLLSLFELREFLPKAAGKVAPPAMRFPSSDILEASPTVSSAAFQPPTTGNSKFYVVCRKLHFPFCAVLPFSLTHPFRRAHGWRSGG